MPLSIAILRTVQIPICRTIWLHIISHDNMECRNCHSSIYDCGCLMNAALYGQCDFSTRPKPARGLELSGMLTTQAKTTLPFHSEERGLCVSGLCRRSEQSTACESNALHFSVQSSSSSFLRRLLFTGRPTT